MSSSLGRLALGIVGAVIGSFFGVPAIGFAIGSAIGGFIFAPEGPKVEGPRLGDTDVTASTLGKIIPEHYGVTRAGGNVFWSGGLKEVKKEEEQGGGKGGGGGGSVTTYSYFASFAIAFGRGRAENVLRIWADGKLIYDVTGSGSVKNGKYNFRFRRGVSNPATSSGTIDPLIAESINRRLAGLPDVNQGNGPQAEYRTINDLISDVAAEPDPRSQIYATYLTALRDSAEAGGGSPPNYRFTPSYKEVAYIVFVDMPLEDFGNRIPNITAEIVWKTDSVVDPNSTVTETPVTEFSPSTGVPADMMAVDPFSRAALVISDGNRLRRFGLNIGSETAHRSTNYGSGVNMVLPICSDASGDWIVRGTTQSNGNKLYKLDNTSLTLKSGNQDEMGKTAKGALFGVNAGISGTSKVVAICNAAGDFALVNTAGGAVVDLYQRLDIGLGPGPMAYGGGEPGDTYIFWASANSSDFRVHRINIKFADTAKLFGFDAGIYAGIDPGVFGDLVYTAAGTSASFTTMDTRSLSGGTVSACIFDYQTTRLYVVIRRSGGGGTVYEYDPTAEGTGGDPYLVDSFNFSGTPPDADSGWSRSGLSGSNIIFANGNDAYQIDMSAESEFVYTNVLSGNAAASAQVFEPNSGTLFTWLSGDPTLIQFARLGKNLYSTDLSSVVADVCERVGMLPDEFDTSGIDGTYRVKGYTIARPSNGRAVLEKLFQAYFVDGIESDWKLKFKPQDSSPVRTIEEWELGKTQSPTGDVPFLETRVPEQDLPSEVSIIFSDSDRDYQQGAGHYRRVSQPTPTMYSKKIENIEFPLVFTEREGRSIAERILFLAWMSRDQGKTRFPWTHIDLDPADVVQFKFNDGRILTDRLIQMNIGANFEIEATTVRSGDPVFVPSEDTNLNTASIPVNSILTPAFSKIFVLDMPLLYDYHDLGRISTRYYTAVGSDTASFVSADLYQSVDGLSYLNFDSINVDCTWGTVVSGPLGAPRSLHSTDYDNTFTVALSVDNGDLSSTTLDQIVNGTANRALIVNPLTGDVEILQFQNVTANPDGTYTFDTLVRGRRGTDYTVSKHTEGEVFIYVTDAAVVPQVNDLTAIGATRYFKAVSRGGLIATSPAVGEFFEGRDMKPYAPNYVRRTDNGTDLTVLWNRRTRIGGAWNMTGIGIEDLPLNEDFEQYECYLLPNTPTALEDFNPNDATTYVLVRQVASPQAVFTGVELATATYTLDDPINVAVYQLSAQVGRGFGRIVSLDP